LTLEKLGQKKNFFTKYFILNCLLKVDLRFLTFLTKSSCRA